jgi:hypothetical protein
MKIIELKIGSIFYDAISVHNKVLKCRVIHILDKEPEKQIIYKFYHVRRQRWEYKVETEYIVNYCIKKGMYKLKKGKRK